MARDRYGVEGRLLKLTLIGTFLTSIGLTGTTRGRDLPRIGPFELLLLGLASYRIGRMIAFERVAQPLREPFTATVPDESGADETVVARGRGVRWVIGELMSCPTCVATWAALVLYVGLALVPGPTRMLVNVLAAVGVAEIAHVSVEQLEWSSRASRRQSASV